MSSLKKIPSLKRMVEIGIAENAIRSETQNTERRNGKENNGYFTKVCESRDEVSIAAS
jgi:hypothetical protein